MKNSIYNEIEEQLILKIHNSDFSQELLQTLFGLTKEQLSKLVAKLDKRAELRIEQSKIASLTNKKTIGLIRKYYGNGFLTKKETKCLPSNKKFDKK